MLWSFQYCDCAGECVSAQTWDQFVTVEILTGRDSSVILVSQDLSFFSSRHPLNRKTNIISYHMYLETTADYQSAELSLSLSFTWDLELYCKDSQKYFSSKFGARILLASGNLLISLVLIYLKTASWVLCIKFLPRESFDDLMKNCFWPALWSFFVGVSCHRMWPSSIYYFFFFHRDFAFYC